MLSAKDIISQFTSGRSIMDTICDFIIRPPRCEYTLDSLGPKMFRISGSGKTRYEREDLELENMRGMTIQCSWFRPMKTDELHERLPCVVYCHANCGGRYDGLEALFLLEHGFSLFTFDFCGSGMSEGENISLGFYERQDLAAVTEYLNSKPTEVDGIALWGRSMGAVTSIMYAAKDPSIRCVVCDSPFASLRWVIQDLVINNGGRTAQYIPGAIIRGIVERIRKRIARRAAFDIDDLNTVKYASECVVPGLLFHGEEDDFVLPKQSMAVRDAFQGSCLHLMVKGGHNDERDYQMQRFIASFIHLYTIEKPQAAREQAASSGADPHSTATVAAVATNASASLNQKSGLTSYEVVTTSRPTTMLSSTAVGSASVAAPPRLTTEKQSVSGGDGGVTVFTSTHDSSCAARRVQVSPTGAEGESQVGLDESGIMFDMPRASGEHVTTDDDASITSDFCVPDDIEVGGISRPHPISFTKPRLTEAESTDSMWSVE